MEITNDQSPVEVLSDSDDVTSSVPETPIPSTSKAKECTTPNKVIIYVLRNYKIKAVCGKKTIKFI